MTNGAPEKKSVKNQLTALYAKGMTTRQISETIEDIYGFEVSNGTTFERDGFKAGIIFPPLLAL